jgi:hypothetical protein
MCELALRFPDHQSPNNKIIFSLLINVAAPHARSSAHSTAQLRLSGLIGKAIFPDMQKTRKIVFFFENILQR